MVATPSLSAACVTHPGTIRIELGLEPATFLVLVLGAEDHGVGGIEIAIGLRPQDGSTEMRGAFIGRGGIGVEG